MHYANILAKKLCNFKFSTSPISSVGKKMNGHNNWQMMELLLRITRILWERTLKTADVQPCSLRKEGANSITPCWHGQMY